MSIDLLRPFSTQASDIYRLLLDGEDLTAKDIASNLHIYSNTVYRAVQQLIYMGFVEEINVYPVRYRARKQSEALEFYFNIFKHNFIHNFQSKHNKSQSNNKIDVSFIRTRDDLLNNTDSDVKNAKEHVNFIVSGLEVPAETIFVYKKAVDRGVKIRALVQRLDDTSGEMFKNWKKIGVDVKYYPNMEARTFIIDKSIVYFTSYIPEEKQEAVGMRFNYIPYARIMDELFEQRWKIGREI